MIPAPSQLGAIVDYDVPIQVNLHNPTSTPKSYYLGGALVHPESVTNAGQVFTNPNFEQGATGWSSGVGWSYAIGSATFTLLAPPTSTSGIGQSISGLTVGRQYTMRIRASFSSAFTGFLVIIVGIQPPFYVPINNVLGFYSYETTVVADFILLNPFSVQFDSIAPTAAGTQVQLLGIDLLDSNNPDVQFYKFWQNMVVTSPARMIGTRFMSPSVEAILRTMYYVRQNTSTFNREYLNLLSFLDPANEPAYGIIDAHALRYILDGQNFLEFVLPAGARLTWNSWVDRQLLLEA